MTGNVIKHKKDFSKKGNLSDIGEFGLISKIRAWQRGSNSSIFVGIGDDSAVIKLKEKVLLITTDILIEGVHFDPRWIDPYRLGKKSLYVNLSDIAAMGGKPKYFLISLGMPDFLKISYISSFYRGLKDGAKRFGVNLIGGDTSFSEKFVINICMLGEGLNGNVILRNGARVGDDIYVTGTLGDSALGFEILKKEGLNRKPKGLIERHLSPLPRIEIGLAINRNRLANSMIDISDGLLIDISHILTESKVGAMIWEDKIPLSKLYKKWVNLFSNDYYRFAKTGGEDYELLFTASPKLRNRIYELSRSANIPITKIGQIVPKKEGFYLIKKDMSKYYPRELGFEHFK